MDLLTDEQIEELKGELENLPPDQQQERAKEILSRLSPDQVKQLMGGGTQCPFCLMSEGKIQTSTVFENSKFKAVLEINPANLGHILLFPKEHITKTSLLSRLDHEELFSIVQKLDLALLTLFEATNIFVSNGLTAGQRFDHALIHIIPREKNDRINFGWTSKKTSTEELTELAKAIKSNLPQEKIVKETQIDINDLLSNLPSYKRRIP